jgi:hypothetical protein
MYHVPELRVNRMGPQLVGSLQPQQNAAQSTTSPLASSQAARHYRLQARSGLPPGSSVSDLAARVTSGRRRLPMQVGSGVAMWAGERQQKTVGRPEGLDLALVSQE